MRVEYALECSDSGISETASETSVLETSVAEKAEVRVLEKGCDKHL